MIISNLKVEKTQMTTMRASISAHMLTVCQLYEELFKPHLIYFISRGKKNIQSEL